MNGNAGHNEGNESEDERASEEEPASLSVRAKWIQRGGRRETEKEKTKMGMRMAAAAAAAA